MSDECRIVTDKILAVVEAPNYPTLRPAKIQAILRKHFGKAREIRAALKNLVECNERWNAAVQELIGRAPGWNDGYLNEARELLKATER